MLYVRVTDGSVGGEAAVIVEITHPTVITAPSQTGSSPFVVV